MVGQSMNSNHYVQATLDLPVYPNGYVDKHHDCACLDKSDIGRAKINNRWVQVCMRCGCVRGAQADTD